MPLHGESPIWRASSASSIRRHCWRSSSRWSWRRAAGDSEAVPLGRSKCWFPEHLKMWLLGVSDALDGVSKFVAERKAHALDDLTARELDRPRSQRSEP